MIFPRTSKGVAARTINEWMEKVKDKDQEAVRVYAETEVKRIDKTNPIIASFLVLATQLERCRKVEFLAMHSLIYGLIVYQMIEEEMKLQSLKMPRVSKEVSDPLREEFRRQGGDRFIEEGMLKLLLGQDPEIAKASSNWVFDFEINRDDESSKAVLMVGLLVYRTLRSQWESDILASQIG